MKSFIKYLLIALFSVLFVTDPIFSDTGGHHRSSYHSRSSHSRSRVYYGGGHHTVSHGGYYKGGSGSSHKGGHYVNHKTNNHYGRHK